MRFALNCCFLAGSFLRSVADKADGLRNGDKLTDCEMESCTEPSCTCLYLRNGQVVAVPFGIFCIDEELEGRHAGVTSMEVTVFFVQPVSSVGLSGRKLRRVAEPRIAENEFKLRTCTCVALDKDLGCHPS